MRIYDIRGTKYKEVKRLFKCGHSKMGAFRLSETAEDLKRSAEVALTVDCDDCEIAALLKRELHAMDITYQEVG